MRFISFERPPLSPLTEETHFRPILIGCVPKRALSDITSHRESEHQDFVCKLKARWNNVLDFSLASYHENVPYRSGDIFECNGCCPTISFDSTAAHLMIIRCPPHQEGDWVALVASFNLNLQSTDAVFSIRVSVLGTVLGRRETRAPKGYLENLLNSLRL